MENPSENVQSNRHFTIGACAGNLMMECFIASRTFSGTARDLPAFTEEHLHSSYELLICRQGSGFQFVDGIGHRYEDDSVFVFAPFVKHANISDRSSPEQRYSIRFELPADQPANLAADPRMTAALQQLSREGCFFFRADGQLLQLISMLSDTICSDIPNPELLLSGLLSAVFSHVFHALCLSCKASGEPHGDWMFRSDASQRKFLLDYYFDHLMYTAAGSDVKMEDICTQLHLSPSQLNRVLKETYGTTFKKKSIEVRLAYIRYYLQYSDLSVSEIARRTNFVSDSSFSLFFKQHTGLSPTQYRKQEE